MKAKDVVEAIIQYSNVPVPPKETCDGYKAGEPDTEITGVVTTFMATAEVIRQAAALGANMIITHEPTYFTGRDTTEWLANDPVYEAKRRLIEEHGMVIWRYHDLMHMMKPDGIYEGFLEELGWQQYARGAKRMPGGEKDMGAHFVEAFSDYYDLPETTVMNLALFLKKKLGMDTIQVVGRPDMPCSRVGVLVGGGSLGFGIDEMPIKIMEKHKLDVLVCGEILEWTVCAYVNDAKQLGQNKAMIVLGHERSEEWGMKHMKGWLSQKLEGTPVHFVDAKEPFTYF